MGHHHHHHAGHHHGESTALRNIRFVLFLNLGFAAFELLGGWYFNSVAVIADAIHDLGDAATLGLALVLERFANRAATQKFSYGFRRLSLLSAVATAVVLVVGATLVAVHAVGRLAEPSAPVPEGMMLMAVIGLAVNGYAAWLLLRGRTMNEKVLSWHLLEDVAGWFVVFIAGAVIYAGGPVWIDPAISLLLCGVIIFGVFRTFTESLGLFLQAAPAGVPMDNIKSEIATLSGIDDVHDMHCWSLDGERHVMSLHLSMSEQTTLQQAQSTKSSVRQLLQKYGKFHTTIETEIGGECHEPHCRT
jgi:cobalt-zinc-cadmium efflux system protein